MIFLYSHNIGAVLAEKKALLHGVNKEGNIFSAAVPDYEIDMRIYLKWMLLLSNSRPIQSVIEVRDSANQLRLPGVARAVLLNPTR